MSDDRKYVRVYYSVIDDERFEHVYCDDAALAAWLRMLLDADALWPASASLPRMSRRVLQVLTASGLVEVTGSRFRVHGLDAERQRRADAGRAGGLASGRSRMAGTVGERTFNERPTVRATESNLAEQSRDETSKDEQSRETRPDVEAFLGTRFRLPTSAQRTFMDTYCQVFDQTGPERAARLIWSRPDDPIGALKEDLTAFREGRRVEAVASEVPKPRRGKGSGMSKVSDELAKVYLAPSNGNGTPVPLADLVTPEALAAAGRTS